MGCFSYTCAISGLPVEGGDPVRYFLLTESPYAETSSINAEWFPRTFPVRGMYDDYGRVEMVQGPLHSVWREGFQIDLVECGWGANTVREHPVLKTGTLELMLKAINTQRLRVRRESPPLCSKPISVPKGVPTRKRIEKILRKSGFAVPVEPLQPGFLVAKSGHGEVRIRYEGADVVTQSRRLGVVSRLLIDYGYAPVVVAGDSIRAQVELRVRPKPSTPHFHGSPRRAKKSLRVQHAMIREDVWQAILKLKVDGELNYRPVEHTIDDYYKGIQYVYDRVKSTSLLDCKSLTDDQRALAYEAKMLRMGLVDEPGTWILRNSVPFIMGLGSHWDLLLKHELTPDVLATVAEFAFIHRVLDNVRYWWRPSYPVGAQGPEWKNHKDFHETLLIVAADHVVRTFDDETLNFYGHS